MNRLLSRSLLVTVGATLGGCSAETSEGPTAERAPAIRSLAFTVIDVPGATGTLATDINESGVIVGRYGSAGITHGFLRSTSGEFTMIDFPGSVFTVAAGINNAGDIVGQYATPEAPLGRHGFLLRNGQFTTLDPGGSGFTNALGINDRGDISGRFCEGACGFHGFLFRDGRFTILNAPEAFDTHGWKVEDGGVVVGGFIDQKGLGKLFRFEQGVYRVIRLPNGRSVRMDNGGINLNGDIVGAYCANEPCTFTHGFLLRGQQLRTIDYPGAVSTSTYGINAGRQIVGGFTDELGASHGFLLNLGTP